MKPESALLDTRAVSIRDGPMNKFVCGLLWLPVSAWAQSGAPAVAPETPVNRDVPLLGTVEALRPDLEPPPPRTDPFLPRPSTFRKYWKQTPTPEQVALDHNGYIAYGVTKGLIAGGRCSTKSPVALRKFKPQRHERRRLMRIRCRARCVGPMVRRRAHCLPAIDAAPAHARCPRGWTVHRDHGVYGITGGV